jgi:hypothetical protein
VKQAPHPSAAGYRMPCLTAPTRRGGNDEHDHDGYDDVRSEPGIDAHCHQASIFIFRSFVWWFPLASSSCFPLLASVTKKKEEKDIIVLLQVKNAMIDSSNEEDGNDEYDQGWLR